MKKTFKEITHNIDMVLFNNIINIDPDLELEAWNDIKEDEYKDIYQYFAINRWDGEYLSRITEMPFYYSSKCDLFIIWIDFLDNWGNVTYKV